MHLYARRVGQGCVSLAAFAFGIFRKDVANILPHRNRDRRDRKRVALPVAREKQQESCNESIFSQKLYRVRLISTFLVISSPGPLLEILHLQHVQPIHNHHGLDQISSQIQMPVPEYTSISMKESQHRQQGERTKRTYTPSNLLL